jgi:hypothetical protein
VGLAASQGDSMKVSSFSEEKEAKRLFKSGCRQ